MCDCYGHECEVCGEIVQMHLGDFNTERDELKVYCNKHIPEGKSGILWEITDDEDKLEIGKRVFVEALTANAKKNFQENCPNVYNCKIISQY